MRHGKPGYFYPKVLFPHELLIQTYLIIYWHWKMCFLLPTVWPCQLWSTHLWICVCMFGNRQSCHGQKQSWAMIHSQTASHLITPKSGHTDAQEKQMLYGANGWSDPSHASQTTLRSPWIHVHVSRISISPAQTKEISAHLVCQRWPDKLVYVLNTSGTLAIPDRPCHNNKCFLLIYSLLFIVNMADRHFFPLFWNDHLFSPCLSD